MRKKKVSAAFLAAVMVVTSFNYTNASGYADEAASTTVITENDTVDAAQNSEEEIDYESIQGDLGFDDSILAEDDYINSLEEYYESVNDEMLEQGVTYGLYSLDGASTELPSSVDNSDSKYFPPITNQGSIGSCVTQAEVYYQFSYEVNRLLDRTASKSNSFNPLFVYSLINDGEDSGSIASDAYLVLKNLGAVPNSSYSNSSNYLSWNAGELWNEAGNYRLQSYQKLSSNLGYDGYYITSPDDSDLDVVKAALADGNILSFSSCTTYWYAGRTTIKSSDKAPENAKYAGQYILTKSAGAESGHRLTIVGYNDDIWVDINGNGEVEAAEKGAFKIANSWGTGISGHNGGYVWMSYDAINRTSQVSGVVSASNRARIMSNIIKISVQPYDNDSDIKLVYTVNSANRADSEVRLTATSKNGGSKVTKSATPYYVKLLYNSSSRKYTYDGTVASKDATMYMDLDTVISGINSENLLDYTWEMKLLDDYADNYVSILKDAKVVDYNTGKVYKFNIDNPISVDGGTATVLLMEAEIPTATIYYKGDSNPYINYQVGTGAWNYVAMDKSDDVEDAEYKYVIELKDDSYANVSFYSNGTWDKNEGSYFKVEAGEYIYENGFFAKYGPDEIRFSEFTLNKTSITEGESITLTAKAKNADLYEVGFDIYDSNGKLIKSQSFSYATSFNAQMSKAGTYTAYAYVKTYAGAAVKSMAKTFTVSPKMSDNTLTIYYSGYSNPNIHYQVGTGSWTAVPGHVMTPCTEVEGTQYKYVIDLGTSTYANVCFNDGKGNWDSKNGANYRFEAGEYIFKNGVITKYDPNALKISEFTVNPNTITVGEYVTLTAKAENSSLYEVQFIIYDSNGNLYMQQSYSYATSWNPQINKAGTYTVIAYAKEYYGSPVVSETKTFTVSPKMSDNTVTIYYSGYSNPNIHYQVGTGSWTAAPGYAMTKCTEVSGYDYKYVIDLGTSTYANVCFNDGKGNWDSKNGANYRFEAGEYTFKNGTITEYNSDEMRITEFTVNPTTITAGESVTFTAKATSKYSYEVSFQIYDSNGKAYKSQSYSYATSWRTQMSQAGTYTVVAYAKEYYGSPVVSETKTFTVLPKASENSVTIYYSGYNNPNIHYQVGTGSWTSVPGVKMNTSTKYSGYGYEYTIDLGSSAYTNVCFNDGYGNWDSKNGQNYRLEAGVYKISNGNVIKIS